MISEEKQERLRTKNRNRQQRIAESRKKVIDGFIAGRGRCTDCGSTDLEDLHMYTAVKLYQQDRRRRNLKLLGMQLAVADVLCTACREVDLHAE